MAGLSEELRRSAEPVWRRILEHPFVRELYTGRLPLEKFRFYAIQDYNYLVGMMRTYSLIAAKSPFWVARKALEIAHADATTELENYKSLLARLGLTLDDAERAEPAPTNVAYMNFLVATAALGTPLEGLVATLPCFWTYQVIAEHYSEELERNPVELYRDWAKVYLSREYASIVEELRSLVDSLYEGVGAERLRKIFLTGSRYEYMFWDMAYRMEEWPV